MSFHVGQKVVCVKDGAHSFTTPSPAMKPVIEVTRGGVYVVRWVGEYQLRYEGEPWGEKYVGVRIIGICRGRLDTPFDVRRFRPLVEDRKSVSFTIGADPDSDIWDNRKKTKEKV